MQGAVAVSEESGVIGSFALRVQLICRQLQLVQRSVREFDQKIAQAYAAVASA